MDCTPNKNDFKITASFIRPAVVNSEGVVTTPEVIVNPLDFKWEIIYYTTKYKPMTVSHSMVEDPDTHEITHILSSNCKIDEETGLISIMTNGFDWVEKGLVKRDITLHIPNPDFTDGIQDFSTGEVLTDLKIT